MRCGKVQIHLIEYLQGVLDTKASRKTQLHLEGCPRCREEAREMDETLKTLLERPILSLSEHYLEGVKNKIKEAGVLTDQRVKPMIKAIAPKRRWFLTPLATAAGLLITISLGFATYYVVKEVLIHKSPTIIVPNWTDEEIRKVEEIFVIEAIAHDYGRKLIPACGLESIPEWEKRLSRILQTSHEHMLNSFKEARDWQLRNLCKEVLQAVLKELRDHGDEIWGQEAFQEALIIPFQLRSVSLLKQRPSSEGVYTYHTTQYIRYSRSPGYTEYVIEGFVQVLPFSEVDFLKIILNLSQEQEQKLRKIIEVEKERWASSEGALLATQKKASLKDSFRKILTPKQMTLWERLE